MESEVFHQKTPACKQTQTTMKEESIVVRAEISIEDIQNSDD